VILLYLLLSFVTFAAAPLQWSSYYDVRNRHEFYKNNEDLLKPKDSWQALFAVAYLDRNLNLIKDCVYYRIPGDLPGVLKIKTTFGSDDCEKYLLAEGTKTWEKLKALKFSIEEGKFWIDLNFEDYRSERWEIVSKNNWARPSRLNGLSSREVKGPKLIYLSSESLGKNLSVQALKKNGDLCHAINDECQELSASSCDTCPEGWYEIPNGCSRGPKYCGVLNCGKKNQYACRRGMRWQRKDQKFDCRVDSSFAYCSGDLKVQCEGQRAICR
jgi:hypothetical protein